MDEDKTEKEVKKEVTLTDKDKEDFFKAFLSDTAYTCTESLFGGKLTVTFKALDVQQAGDVFEQLRKDQANGSISSDALYMMTLTNYRIAQAITDINGVPFQPNITKDKYAADNSDDTYIKAKAEVVKKWPVFKLSAFADSFKTFEDKIIALTKEVQDESFWAAVQ